MPMYDAQVEQEQQKLRILLYGPAKTKKTWWCGTAAEAGYNVLALNGDDGAQIWKNLSPAAQRRIRLLNCMDKFGDPMFCKTVGRLVSGKPFLWDDTDNKLLLPNSPTNIEHGFFEIDPRKLTPQDVLVLDAWTTLKTSVALQYSKENNIDLSDAEKTEWEGYGYSGRYLDWILAQLKSFNCHIIVIAHNEVYEKKKKVNIGGRESEITEWTRTQPISSSRNHGGKLAADFTDVFFTSVKGSQFMIDTTSSSDRDCGSRVIPPKVYKWEELPFAEVVRMAHAFKPVPDCEMPGCKYYAPGTYEPRVSVSSANAGANLAANTAANNSLSLGASPKAAPAKGLAAFGKKP